MWQILRITIQITVFVIIIEVCKIVLYPTAVYGEIFQYNFDHCSRIRNIVHLNKTRFSLNYEQIEQA